MSWYINPFKKAFSNRRTKQEDVELSQEVQLIHHVQVVSKRLYKDMRKSTEADTSIVKASNRTVQELKSSPASKSSPLMQSVDVLCTCNDRLHANVKDLKNRQDILFADPMKRFYNVYKHLDFHIKQRELKLQELEKQQGKLEKVKDTHSSTAKFELAQRKVSSARSDYERVQQRLMVELPQVYQGRVDFFEPCVTAALQSELLYHQECVQSLQEAVNHLEKQETNSEGAQETNHLLDSIRSLSIVGGPV